MIWTFLVSVSALIVAVLGCALLKPLGALEGESDADRRRWWHNAGPDDNAVGFRGH